VEPAQHEICEVSAPYIEESFEPPFTSAFRIETPDGFVIGDRGVKMKPGDEVAFQYDSYPMVDKLFASGLITQDGETIDGEGREGIIVLGKVTATILDDDDELPADDLIKQKCVLRAPVAHIKHKKIPQNTSYSPNGQNVHCGMLLINLESP